MSLVSTNEQIRCDGKCIKAYHCASVSSRTTAGEAMHVFTVIVDGKPIHPSLWGLSCAPDLLGTEGVFSSEFCVLVVGHSPIWAHPDTAVQFFLLNADSAYPRQGGPSCRGWRGSDQLSEVP